MPPMPRLGTRHYLRITSPFRHTIMGSMNRECAWCGAEFAINTGPGRPAKYCKHGCRQQAYRTRLAPYDLAGLKAQADRTDGCCYICGTELLFGVDMEFDHVWTGDRGGPDALWNLRPVCHTCNLEKGAKVRFVPILVHDGSPSEQLESLIAAFHQMQRV